MAQRGDLVLSQKTREEFDDWAGRYESGLLFKVFFQTLHRRFVRKIELPPGSEWLDVGCGTGAVSRRLARKGARVVGIDYSQGMLSAARSLSRGIEDLDFIRGTVDSLPFEDRRFDGVATAFSFHHFPDAENALREMCRVLRPGGEVFVCDATRNGMLSRAILRLFHYFMAKRQVHVHGEEDGYHTYGELKDLLKKVGLSEVRARIICILPWVVIISGKQA